MEVKFFRSGRHPHYYGQICRRFGWNITSETVNGHSVVDVAVEDIPVLEETARRGFLGIIKRHENGEDSVCKTCQK